MQRLIQISDLHLFSAADLSLKGRQTRQGFLAVLAHIREHYASVDRLLITGDLAHDGQAETYEMLRESLGDLAGCSRVLPGNHDVRMALRSVFPEELDPRSETLNFSDLVGDWHIIGLDTQDTGLLSGRLTEEQLAWLTHCLDEYDQHPTMIFMHHPPLHIGSAWIDAMLLQEPAAFQGIVAKAEQVRAVCCGHIHQAFEGQMGSTALWTVPSTSMQFKPATTGLELDDIPPGFRLIELDGASIRTEIIRVPIG